MCDADTNLFVFLGVKFPNQASSISFLSKGPTAGLLIISDIAEDKHDAAATETEAEQNDENNEVTCRWIVM